MRTAVATLCFACVLASGCSRNSSRLDYAEYVTEHYGGLVALRKLEHPELQAELARIEAEGGTPAQLDSDPPDARENAAAGLMGLFPLKSVERLRTEAVELVPRERFTHDPFQLERAIQLWQRHAKAWTRAREALDRPAWHSGHVHRSGFFADTSFIDTVELIAWVESCHAAGALAEDDLPAAVTSCQYLLKSAGYLASEQHVVSRLTGARIRRLGLRVAEAITQHPHLKLDHVTAIAETLAMQLANWPADARAWIGDRALGLHTYEAIRGGDLAWLLTDDELQSLVADETLPEFEAAVLRRLDEDELFYLQWMRKVIADCDRPYYRRRELLARMQLAMTELEDTPRYPLVAARMLLRDVDTAQREQAADRAACEAWCATLSLAAGITPPAIDRNPVSGGRYRLTTGPAQATLTSRGTPLDAWPETIVVPYAQRNLRQDTQTAGRPESGGRQ